MGHQSFHSTNHRGGDLLWVRLSRLRFLSFETVFWGGDRDPLLGEDRDRLRLLLGGLRPFFLLNRWRRVSLLRLPLLLPLLRDASEEGDRQEELLRCLLPACFRLLLPNNGDRLLERLMLPFLRLLLGGDRLRLREDDGDLIPNFRSPRFSFGDSFFGAITLGGDLDLSWLRLLLLPRLLGGDLLEDRGGDLLVERLLSFPLLLGGDLLEPLPLGRDRLEDREGDLMGERCLFLLLPLGGDLLEGRRGDLPDKRLLCLPVPLDGDLRADFRWSRSCFDEMTFGGDRDRSWLLLRPPSFLRLLDSDDDGDLALLSDLPRSARFLSLVITLGGDRDRPSLLPLRRLSFLSRFLDRKLSLDGDEDEADESLLCPLLLLPRLLRPRFDE